MIIRLKAGIAVSGLRTGGGATTLTLGGELGIVHTHIIYIGESPRLPEGDDPCRDIELFKPIKGARWVFESMDSYTKLSALEQLALEAE